MFHTHLSIHQPLRFKKIGDHAPWHLMLFGVGMLVIAMTIFTLTHRMSHSIFADWQLGRQPHHALKNARIKAECNGKLFIAFCSCTIKHGGNTWKKNFAIFTFGHLRLNAIASDADPELVTLDVAAHKTVNRSVFALLLMAIAGGVGFTAFKSILSSIQHRQLMAAINQSHAHTLHLLEKEVRMPNDKIMQFATSNDIGASQTQATLAKTDLWILSRNRQAKTARVLAAALSTGGISLPIDTAFACFEGLNNDDKLALRQTVNRYLSAQKTHL